MELSDLYKPFLRAITHTESPAFTVILAFGLSTVAYVLLRRLFRVHDRLAGLGLVLVVTPAAFSVRSTPNLFYSVLFLAGLILMFFAFRLREKRA